MSSSTAPRRRKNPTQETRSPMFEVRDQPLPPAPRPIQNTRDPFDDPPETRPRRARRATLIHQQPPAPRLLTDEVAPLPMAKSHSPLSNVADDLYRAQMLEGRTSRQRPVYRTPAPRASALEVAQQYPWLVLLLGGVCLAIILLLSPSTQPIVSYWQGRVIRSSTNFQPNPRTSQNVPAGEHSVLGEPTISAADVDAVLAKYGSPAAGTGRIWVEMGKRYGINPAYALAFFIHESSAGTNSGWAGLKPDGSTTHNIGNIICAGYGTCFGRFRDYATWDEGIEDWYKLIYLEYVGDRGIQTVEQILPIYAPSSDNNDVPNYVQSVVGLVDSWRRGVR
jgi:hypothetical protein